MVSRRSFLGGSGAAATLAVASRALAEWQPSQPYPDPSVKIVDQSFARYRLNLAKVERLATGFRWPEGPAWFGDGLVTCEHGLRRVSRTEYDGTITTVADKFESKPLNSPNDVVGKSDGSIWFTDPPFGIFGFYEGYVAKPELPTNVYRVDAKGGPPTVATGDVNRPNGLAFSPDESKLYVVEAGTTPRQIVAFDVVGSTPLTNKRKLIDPGPDGFRCDVDGNLWCGWGMGQEGLDGVHVFNPDSKLIARINLPERCANLCFGGTYRNRLFMVASTSLYSLYVNTQGAIGG